MIQNTETFLAVFISFTFTCRGNTSRGFATSSFILLDHYCENAAETEPAEPPM